MSSTDPHQSSDLFDMAKDGTSIPNDAGKMNLIPSVPRPDQINDSPNDLGAADLSGAADNTTDIARANKDSSTHGKVLTGTGDQLPAQVESKRLHFGANNPLAKGHDRYDKHTRQKESDLERYAAEGAGMDEVPGEEGDGPDVRGEDLRGGEGRRVGREMEGLRNE
ncbi:MAG: hypothetical protein MMC33_008915 [Icmadophila ericetorum]|nr:hypothetical protein [Icmadophila ericetorum]